MKLSTGKVAFPIEFDNGDKETIYFNPADPDLMIRMKKFSEKALEKIGVLDDVELDEYGNAQNASQVDTFEKMQNVLKEELDYAFGGSVSDIVFKHCSPFAIVGGEYFVVQFAEAIMPEIEKHIKKAKADFDKRASKHLDKYRK